MAGGHPLVTAAPVGQRGRWAVPVPLNTCQEGAPRSGASAEAPPAAHGPLPLNRPLCLSSADPRAAKLHGILTDEAFEFYCSQCHRQINRLEDLSARLNDLEKNR